MAMRRHSQDDSGYIWYKDESTRENHAVRYFSTIFFSRRTISLAHLRRDISQQWRLGSFESETEKSRGHGKALVKWTEVTIKTRDGKKIKRKRETETRPFNKSHLEEVDDIATMNGMNRASLINALRRRFQNNVNGQPKPLPYTYVSDVLLMMNRTYSLSFRTFQLKLTNKTHTHSLLWSRTSGCGKYVRSSCQETTFERVF